MRPFVRNVDCRTSMCASKYVLCFKKEHRVLSSGFFSDFDIGWGRA
jgi:hypothetical protein